MYRDRVGGKVRSNYKRYVFESAEEASDMKKQFANHQYNQAQPQERYQPSSSLYEVKREHEKSSVYMSCKPHIVGPGLHNLGLKCLKLGLDVTDVLRQLVQATFKHHFPTPVVNSP